MDSGTRHDDGRREDGYPPGEALADAWNEHSRYVGFAAGLFGLGVYLFVARSGQAVFIWFIWGVLALGLAYAGPTDPIDDSPLDRKRFAVGVLTFLLGLACFTPIPIEVAAA